VLSDENAISNTSPLRTGPSARTQHVIPLDCLQLIYSTVLAGHAYHSANDKEAEAWNSLSLSLSLGLSGIPQTTQTVLGVYIKRTCSLDTSASSALGALDDIHALIHSLTIYRITVPHWLRFACSSLQLLGRIACTHCIDAAYCHRHSVVCVCLLVTTVSPTRTAEPSEVPFGVWTPVSPRKHILD